jgi:hypothetical protein
MDKIHDADRHAETRARWEACDKSRFEIWVAHAGRSNWKRLRNTPPYWDRGLDYQIREITPAETPTPEKAKVLVIVDGGVATTHSDPMADVFVFDVDDHRAGGECDPIPARFASLAEGYDDLPIAAAPKPRLRLIDWSRVPRNVMTNHGTLLYANPVAAETLFKSDRAWGASVTDIATKSLRLSPANQQPWIVYDKLGFEYEALLWDVQTNVMKLIGLAEGYTDDPAAA